MTSCGGDRRDAEVTESADTSARVRSAIAALPDGQRDAVRLFYLQGLSHVSAGEDLLARKYIMILAERGGDRRLPMWIGPAEATALALESAEAPRPFTYKLAVGLVDAAGSAICEVRITSLIAQVFAGRR